MSGRDPFLADDAALAAVRRARDRVLDGAGPGPGPRSGDVRGEIATSWSRSRRLGVEPGGVDVPFEDPVERPHRLLEAATPVIDRLASLLTDTTASILLADAEARILDRWACRWFLPTLDRFSVAPGFTFAEHRVGTNGLGSALEEKRLFEVRGPEHFRDCLQSLVCVAAPIVSPTTRVTHGALNLTCSVEEANGLLRPLVQQAVAEIEQRMLEASSVRERLLLDAYLSTSRRSTGAVLAVGPDLVMANSAADQLVTAADRTLLWHWASDALRTAGSATRILELADGGRLAATARRIADGGPVDGAVIELRPARGAAGQHRRTRSRGPARPHPLEERIAGRSPAARRLRRAVAAAATDPAPLVVSGPEGSGRTFLASAIVAAAGLRGCASVVVDDLPRRTFPPGLGDGDVLVARNLDRTPVDRLDRILGEAAGRGVRLIATAGPTATAELSARFARRIEVPPLLGRLDDIPDLTARILLDLAPAGASRSVTRPAMQALLRHDWPGNVRELRAALAVAVDSADGGEIAVFHLPDALNQAVGQGRWSPIEQAERRAILTALREHEGNKVAAAAALGVARSTLYRKLRTFHIDVA